jgi:hypothetical protein
MGYWDIFGEARCGGGTFPFLKVPFYFLGQALFGAISLANLS